MIKIKHLKTKRWLTCFFALSIILVGLPAITLTLSSTSYAGWFSGPTCNCATCATAVGSCSRDKCACTSNKETVKTIDHIHTDGNTDTEFLKHEEWLVLTVFQDHVLPSMMMMADQISTIAMQQMQIIGTFFDAKHQLETQRLLQELQAQAHKDYHPSTGMCRFGTNMRSLATADSLVHFNQRAIAARNTQRLLMTRGAIGTGSARDDSRSRLDQFKHTYCNPKDFGNALDLLCKGSEVERYNKDINYTNNVQDQDTLNVNFTNEDVTPDEEDILALSANLYGNLLLPKIPEIHIADTKGNLPSGEEGAKAYMDTRALAAKRSVAFNSFAAQIALKGQGPGEKVVPYMTEILKEMGIPEQTITRMLTGHPSYHAQMEVLTKKLYQWPNFYSDLYDKPVNVDRKDTAINALALIQKRDIYRSQLRSEANMAVWLETLLENQQEYHTNEIDKITESDNKILFNLGL